MCEVSVGLSDEAVRAFDGFAAIVQTFRADALTAGVMKPAVL